MFGRFIPIAYGGYWDAPISFITEYQEAVYLFTRYDFDEELDAYPDNYDVFVVEDMPFREAVSRNLWYPYNFTRKTFIGTVPFHRVIFDASRKRLVHTSVFGIIRQSETGIPTYPE